MRQNSSLKGPPYDRVYATSANCQKGERKNMDPSTLLEVIIVVAAIVGQGVGY